MEIGAIGIKAILLVFVMITAFSISQGLPGSILFYLIYLIVNLLMYIVRNNSWKQVIILLSIIYMGSCAYLINPLYALLLPMNVYEFISLYTSKTKLVFMAMLVPLIWIPQDLLALYGLIAVLSFIIFNLSNRYINRTDHYELNIEKMNKHIEKLTKSLNDNNEYLKQSEYTCKLEERNRISQEIHDKIGHSMTGALIQMEAARTLIETDKPKAMELLQNAIHISKDGIESIRLTLKNIKPPMEQMGINRMKLFVEEFTLKHNRPVSFSYEGDVDVISSLQWKIIQENTQEALTNTMKYADATAISVKIRVLNTVIRIEISDNGKGALRIVKGLGIMGMEERTASVNGTIIIDGSNGFSVAMLLPYLNQ